MKKILLFSLVITFVLSGMVLFGSCSEDSLDSKSVVIDSVNEMNEFDEWLEENFRAAYNIQFKYKFEDIESDMTYDLVPAEIDQSIILAKLVKYLWLEPYAEVAGTAFMRSYTPRIIHIVGTVGYNINNGTYTLGTAEGGLKITLYAGNWLVNWFQIVEDPSEERGYTITLDVDNINFYYLHTMHHEFGHILHQTKEFTTDYQLISAGSYTASWQSRTDQEAALLGFISPYAAASPYEDFVEMLSYYISLSDADWNAKLRLGGTEGAAKINTKLQYVKEYMRDFWNIDLEVLKQVVRRRYAEVYEIDWVNL